MNIENFYDIKFFENLEKTAFDSSQKIVPLVLKLYKTQSVIDVGCGNGVWLNTFEKFGIKEYIGIDGEYVKKEFFHADFSKFINSNLEIESNLNRKFDLAVCLEVGEHLKHSSAASLVKTLTNHSDTILFSAAIPQQSGTHHVNEQWQSYWAQLFYHQGYKPNDTIRPLIWNQSSISYWYRQNIVIYTRSASEFNDFKFLDKMHPELYFRIHKISNIFRQFFVNPNYVLSRFLNKRGI
jgi:cyclopropane fatty-acyl-phospholipid synthase-like methyltransferase